MDDQKKTDVKHELIGEIKFGTMRARFIHQPTVVNSTLIVLGVPTPDSKIFELAFTPEQLASLGVLVNKALETVTTQVVYEPAVTVKEKT